MDYKGVNSIIKVGESVTSKRQTYKVKEILNIGLANTYVALNSSNREVILKQFKNRSKEFKNNQRKIFRKIRAIREADEKFKHYIEYPLEQFEYSGYFFEVKSKIDGENLEDFLYSKNVDFKTRLHIAMDIAKIVAILHKYDVIHTDLKLEQFMVVKNRLVKIIDFSNVIIGNKVYNPAGTPGWNSPEHIKKEKITKKSDVFSLALIIFTLLTLTHPYAELLENGTYKEKLLDTKPKRLTDISPHFPYSLSNLLQRALSIDSKERPSAWELFEGLKVFYKPFLASKNKKLFLYSFPFEFDRKKASLILPNFLSRFIYSPHFIIEKKNKDYFIKTVKLPRWNEKEKYYYPLLNGKKFRYEKLSDGDKIKIGKIELIFYKALV